MPNTTNDIPANTNCRLDWEDQTMEHGVLTECRALVYLHRSKPERLEYRVIRHDSRSWIPRFCGEPIGVANDQGEAMRMCDEHFRALCYTMFHVWSRGLSDMERAARSAISSARGATQ